MSTVKISVIIPTCHRNDLLAKCLDCLAPGVQTLPAEQYEVIVTDDGSKFTAEQMVREQYPWARWVAGPIKGPAANRNSGASFATHEWLAFTDDDCLPEPSWLENYASATTQDVKVYEGKTVCKIGIKTALEESPINLLGGCLWSCNMMVSKSLFAAMHGFTTQFTLPGGEDVDFRKRLVSAKIDFTFVEAAVVDHPPRKRRWGKKAALMWEMQTLLMLKANPSSSIVTSLMWLVLRVRLKTLASYPLTMTTLSAFVSFLIEMLYVARHVRGWEKSHRHSLNIL